MSSRSLGLLAGFFVSQGKSSPVSCRLISSGSSVRKRIRPCSRTLSGLFSVLRSNNESSKQHLLRRTAAHFCGLNSLLVQLYRCLSSAVRYGYFSLLTARPP